MTYMLEMRSADRWMRNIFDAKAARSGGSVRRSVKDVETIVGRAAFECELRRRGFHAVENAGQFIIFCNNEPLQVLC